MSNPISGFSKLSKSEKIDWIVSTYFADNDTVKNIITQYWNSDQQLQGLHDEFVENTITNYYLPFGVAPNFLINEKLFTIPMVIEESSVVAAVSRAAKFWYHRGGFKAEVLSTTKVGQVHFLFYGDFKKLKMFFDNIKTVLIEDCKPLTENMERRGGGILDIELVDKSDQLDHYYQLHATFETKDAMGANFINSCLEQFAKTLQQQVQGFNAFSTKEKDISIIMSILSNYVPECLVQVEISCPLEDLNEYNISSEEFANKFIQAVTIAEIETYRAVTHNKGIMNGIDAIVLATGNDFRAVEAGVHAYASRTGSYSSLTHAEVENGIFKFWMEIPLALGTVGGLTSLHPLAKLSLELLQSPSSEELMCIVAAVGLAQNYAAISSLITTGIQEGHMKMHLMNILNQYEATPTEKEKMIEYFKSNTVSHTAVSEALQKIR